MRRLLPATLIFDFDGTIADTMNLTLSIYNEIAPEFGCRTVHDQDRELLRMRRPQDFFREYGMTFLKMPRFATRVRNAIARRIKEVNIFSGIAEVLGKLDDDGFTLGIISSNDEENIRAFLATHHLDTLFDFIWSGKNLFGKAQVIKKCMRKLSIPAGRVAYIGDETRDVEAVKKNGIPMAAVTWGYSAAAVLKPLEPDALVDTPEELYRWIIGHFGRDRR